MERINLKRKKIAALALVTMLQDEEDEESEKKMWVRSSIKKFGMVSMYETSYMDWRLNDQEKFREMLRMSVNSFDELLGKVQHRIEKLDTNFRMAIRPDKRLAITLRYLATGILISVLKVSRHYFFFF